MRRRLSAMLLAIIGLGVPLLVALMARRSEENGASGAFGAGSHQPTPDLLSGRELELAWLEVVALNEATIP